MPNPDRYAAFISYRHLEPDKRWATWLHRALETYRVPKPLVKEGYPARLGRVFRDEEELAAADHLSDEIQEAIEASTHLLVVCSPNTPGSPWVGREIEAFRRVHGDEGILALLVDGEPADAFPDALHRGADGQALEPLAADVRPLPGESTRLRRRHALLRIAAEMLDCGFDDLRRREEARRRRRRLQLAAFGTLLLLALGGLSIWALTERSRADRRRAEAEAARAYEATARADAEALIDFMLFEMRDQLQDAGRLDILRPVIERADAYFTKLPSRHETADSRRRRASALLTLGRIQSAQGDVEDALATQEKAHATLLSAIRAAPDRIDWLVDLATSHERLGDLQALIGATSAAATAHATALEIRRDLLEAEPENVILRQALAASLEKAGLAKMDAGDLPGAFEAFEQALQIARDVAAEHPDPEHAFDLSLKLGHVGLAWKIRGELSRALEVQEEQRTILAALVAGHPEILRYRDGLAHAHGKVAGVLKQAGDLPGAIEGYAAALAIRRELAALDTTNVEARRDVAMSLDALSECRLLQGDADSASRGFEESLAIRRSLAESDPANVENQRDLSISYDRMGSVLERRGDLEGALASYRQGLSIAERLAARDPDSMERRRDLAVGYTSVGRVLRFLERPDAALQEVERAHRISKQLFATDATNLLWRADLAYVSDQLGDARLAAGDADGALAAYRAALDLRARHAAESKDPGWLDGLSVGHSAVGRILLSRGDVEGAIASFTAGMDAATRIAAIDPTNVGWQRNLAVGYWELGDALLQKAALEDALGAYRKALALISPFAEDDPTSVQWQRDLGITHFKIAVVQERRGQIEEAASHMAASAEVHRALLDRAPRYADLTKLLEGEVTRLRALLDR